MYLKHSLPAFLLGLLAHDAVATPAPASTSESAPDSVPDPYKVYTISANNITAKLIGRGARLTSILVPDRDGKLQDVIVGYDDTTKYENDTNYFGPVVGRYANRIKNGTFTIDDKEYHVPENENGGLDTLHGGKIGYDKRDWTVTAHTDTSITFSFYDQALQGFPGDVLTHATFTVGNDITPENPKGLPQLTSRIVALSLTEKTPIMLANHIYWNLNAFREENVLKDTTLHLPLSSRYIASDGILIPNGTIGTVDTAYNGAADFTSPKLIGKDIEEAAGICGTGCTGYDNCFLVDRPVGYAAPDSMVPVVRMSSSATGIGLQVSTNQAAIQIYSCNGQNGTVPVKPSQLKRNKEDGVDGPAVVNQYGCVVIETEDWIDGINRPEWGRLPYQIFTPDGPAAVNLATYQFSTF
ncbi:hypothetical protein P175DRAFT_0435057 [Aspergillus ochraceoroseus IBT 24754]|nr:uncharacterized protein P175DRAFT_0435057 [Aspergillus ochraceoroseus IBT 24754]PTU21462.1 hypothetical protein P175DRAFT_0435057 [Aspergillus ochraceoroseus IBT 24754]